MEDLALKCFISLIIAVAAEVVKRLTEQEEYEDIMDKEEQDVPPRDNN